MAPVVRSAEGEVAGYARVWTSGRKSDLAGQVGFLIAFAYGRGSAVSRSVWEVSSGLNGRRPMLLRLVSDPGVRGGARPEL
jgi:putative resolvase